MTLTPLDDLQKALDAAPPGETVTLAAGTYRQKLLLTTPGVTLRGAGADKTRIVWDDYAKKRDSQGREYNTFRTWTMAVCADGVRMEELAVVNDALQPQEKGQEVALTVYADRFSMENCLLSSTQDTLFLGPLPADLIDRYDGFLPPVLRRDIPCRQVFRNCRIQGTVDFIFGCGQALFDRCEIHSLDRGYLAAPAHAPEQTEGFLFRRCRLTAAPGVAPGSVYLARPWRDYGLCEFDHCVTEGDHIVPQGFHHWENTHRDRTARFYETPLAPGRVVWARTRG